MLSCRSALKRSVAIGLALMLWHVAYGQHSFVVEYLGFADGLPSLNIDAVAQDSQGLIWFASQGTGLIRYDGVRFKVLNALPNSKPRLGSEYVKDVIVDHRGLLWVAHAAGIDIIAPKSLEMIKRIRVPGHTEPYVGGFNSLFLAPNGDIWATEYNKGVYRFIAGDASRMEWVEKIPAAKYVNQMSSGKIVCVTGTGSVLVFEKDHFVPVKFKLSQKYGPSLQFTPIEDPDGIMVGVSMVVSDGITQIYRINPQTDRFETGSPENGITIEISPLIRNRILETTSPLSKNPLYGHSLKNFKDNQGVIWAAPGYGGVFKLKQKEIDFITCPDLKGVSLRGMIEASDGSIYIASYNGVFHYEPHSNRATLVSKFSRDLFFNLAQLRGQTLTVLSESDGLGNYSLQSPWKFTPVSTSGICLDLSFYASLPLDNGWILAGNQQIFKIRKADMYLEAFSSLPMPPNERTFCFKQTRDGRIWVGTTDGVFVLSKNGAYETPLLRQDYRLGVQSRINDIFEDNNGNLWFATHRYGLICFNTGTQQIQAFDGSSGFVSNETYKIESSHDGKILWVSTFSGLQCIELSTNLIHFFNDSDGTSGSEFNTGSFLKSREGDFYFGGVKGLTRFNPNHFISSSAPLPSPYITEISIEDLYSNLVSSINFPKRDTLFKLKNSQNTLEFYFGSNSYFRSKTNTYFVKLENVDNEWVQLGSLTNIKYYRLPSGHYSLKVRFNIKGDKATSEIYTINFEIDEVFYKKWWFIAIISLGILILTYGIYLLGRSRKRREIDLRRSIAHNLHNVLGAEISLISNLVYGINDLNEQKQDFQAELYQLLNQTVKVHSTMSDVIWVLKQHKPESVGLINRIEDYADKWLKLARIKVIFESNIADQDKFIPFAIQHELILVYKEILGNILKHTISEKVHIRFMLNPDKSIELAVRNWFSQRKKDAPSTGHGLLIIQEHMERIGGILRVSAEEQAFEVSIRFEQAFKHWQK